LAVRDNGIGIATEMLSRVFEMFVQDETGRGRDEGGLGIGLSLVRKISEMHGGSVTAKSAGRNRGSEFIITLPLEQPAAARFQAAL
jgi:signal transduction histidine kinase